jgi:hypothetical protein
MLMTIPHSLLPYLDLFYCFISPIHLHLLMTLFLLVLQPSSPSLTHISTSFASAPFIQFNTIIYSLIFTFSLPSHHIIKMGVLFTVAEDAEIIRLKEHVGGSWISLQQKFAVTFPGTKRKHNDLQVRYTRSLKVEKKHREAALAYVPQSMYFFFSFLLSIVFFSLPYVSLKGRSHEN